jgi:hypothetical protein
VHRGAGNALHLRGVNRLGPAHLASHDNAVGRRQSFHGDATMGIGGEKDVNNSI